MLARRLKANPTTRHCRSEAAARSSSATAPLGADRAAFVSSLTLELLDVLARQFRDPAGSHGIVYLTGQPSALLDFLTIAVFNR